MKRATASATAAPSAPRSSGDCPICQDEMKAMASLGCGHVFCFSCIQSVYSSTQSRQISRFILPLTSISTPSSSDCLKDQGKQANCPICRSSENSKTSQTSIMNPANACVQCDTLVIPPATRHLPFSFSERKQQFEKFGAFSCLDAASKCAALQFL